MKTHSQIVEELKAKSATLKKVFDEAGLDMDFSKVTSLEGDTKAKVEKVQTMNAELADLGRQRDELKAMDTARLAAARLYADTHEPAGQFPQPGKGAEGGERKTLGQLIMEKKGQLRPNGPSFDVPFEVKTLFQTSAGWAPESMRLPGAVLSPARPIAVMDFIPQFTTTQAAIKYMLETTATFNAAEKAEAAAYAESAFALTETTRVVEKVTSSIPVTDEQLEDVPAAEAYLNQRLEYDIRRRLDLQVLEGNGVTPNLLGTLSIGGSLQTQALGADTVPDAIYKLFDKLRTVGFVEPSVLFCNPSDWQPVRLLRTADGIYIFGSPMDAGPNRIWGVPVLQTTAVTVNTMIAGDYAGFSGLYVRSGLDVSMGYVNDDFSKGKKTIRAQVRCAMVHFRTSAFGTVTGV